MTHAPPPYTEHPDSDIQLSLNYQDITDDNIHNLVNMLRENGNTTEISLIGNLFTHVGLEHLLNVLNREMLKYLSLKGNPLGPESGSLLAQFLQNNHKLEFLGLGGCGISDAGVTRLVDSLLNTSLVKLYLWGNNIGSRALRHIARALTRNSTLTNLDIGNSDLSDEPSFQQFLQALTDNTSIRALGLGECTLTTACIKRLAKYLESNESLRELDFWGHKLDDSAASALAKALEKNRSLNTLSMRGAQMSEIGAESFLQALQKNIHLTELELPDSLPQHFLHRAARYIARNKAYSLFPTLDAEGMAVAFKVIVNQALSHMDGLEIQLHRMEKEMREKLESKQQLEQEVTRVRKENQSLQNFFSTYTREGIRMYDVHPVTGERIYPDE